MVQPTTHLALAALLIHWINGLDVQHVQTRQS